MRYRNSCRSTVVPGSVLAVRFVINILNRKDADMKVEQFSLTDSSYLTVRLIQTFERIDARDSRPWTELYTIVAYSKYGTQVSLTPSVDQNRKSTEKI